MKSPSSRYENIFFEKTEAPSPGFEIDETASTELPGTLHEYGMQAAQPEIIS
jgi:hypothetical protein